ncbi:peptidase G1 domain-containing protein [Phanerochaete sordida]|uniref:Peptidase G1 domain-containing protein n=1 Tax=Phanerochaete sordida TaxID=48140 RepID=A0A9P3GI34_9APHY|nr:peptidase G1 domain-containing protein [Phanerochaete sordida]
MAWYEWYPDYAYDFTGIDLSGWDSITATVTATSRTSGTATLENTSTGQTVSVEIQSSSSLCQQDAEWIVEDYEEGGALVPFASFGWLGITGAVATSTSGTQADPGSGTVFNMEQNGVLIATAYGSGTNVLFATGQDIGQTGF